MTDGDLIMRNISLLLLPILLGLFFPNAILFRQGYIFQTDFASANASTIDKQDAESNWGRRIAQVPSESIQTKDTFWLPARKLTQDQLFLLHRIEQALAEPDPNRIRAVRGQLLLHVLTLERFLERYYPFPESVCGAGMTGRFPGATLSGPSGFSNSLDEQQGQVYCYLYGSLQKTAQLLPELNRRWQTLSEIAEVRRLPLPPGEKVPNRLLPGVYTFERPDLNEPAKPLFAPAPELPLEEPPVIGRTVKSLLAGYRPPHQPAIAPPREPTDLVEASKQLLERAKQFFPSWAEFVDPEALAQFQDNYTYALRPYDTQPYTQILEQPETGAARLLPANVYRISANELRNRLASTVLERHPFATLPSSSERPSQVPDSLQSRLAPPTVQRYPFAPFPKRAEEFQPSLAVQLEDDTFQIARLGLDYGFIADLGNIPLDKLDARLGLTRKSRFRPASLASPEIRQFFLDYQPPKQLEALQVDRRRFITGKVASFGLKEPLFSQAPVAIDRTYLLRAIQFNLPDAIASAQPLIKSDRRYLDLILDLQSSDMLVAFRPISRRADGSYTVLWKVLKQFPDPPIEDLERYIELR